MPPLNSRATRDLVKKRNIIPGPRSLHRGIHFHENEKFVATYKQNSKAKRLDHRDLLVHHQKINEDLQDIYARTAALHANNATMEERIEESWRQFERIGGKRPNNTNINTTINNNSSSSNNNSNTSNNNNNNNNNNRPQRAGDHLKLNNTGVAFADRLSRVAQEKRELRERSQFERDTRGEAVDYSQGSALHAAKDKRIKLFQKRQLRREHLLRRLGDPTPLKQSGKYDMQSGTLRVFNKTIRKVQREVQHDERTREVKERRGGSGAGQSMWAPRNSEENLNRPTQEIVRYTREFDLGPRRNKKGGGSKKRGRR